MTAASSHSGSSGNACVAVADTDRVILVRDTADEIGGFANTEGLSALNPRVVSLNG